MAPGIIGVSSGRPRPQGNMVHFSCLVDKQKVCPKYVCGSAAPVDVPFKLVPIPASNTAGPVMTRMSKSYPHFVPASYRSLIEFCVGRSGDKGDSANIGVIAREQKYYEWIRAVLTEEVRKNAWKAVQLHIACDEH